MNRYPSQARLLKLIEYSPESGEMRWRIGRPGASKNSICGRVSVNGYREVGIDGRLFRSARLAFIYMTGEAPDIVDHANRVRDDDRWCNLRAATPRQNAVNGSVRHNNTSGISGVTWDAVRSRWRAQARIAGVKKNLGRYESKDDAEAAVRSAMLSANGEFAP